jgi:PBP1b-binding outer membrane lipoprotein LpoB
MKKYILMICAALTLVGCATYQGSPGSDYDTERGTASEMRSPSGLDRARGTNFQNTAPLP